MRIRDPDGYLGLYWGTPNPVNVLALLMTLAIGGSLFLWVGLWTVWAIWHFLPLPW